MNAITHHIVFTKDAQRNLNEKALRNNIDHMMGVMTKSLTARGWTLTTRDVAMSADEKPVPLPWSQSDLIPDDKNKNAYRYMLHFTAQHTGPEKPSTSEIRAITKTMNIRATSPLGGRWALHSIDGTPYVAVDNGEVLSVKDFIAYKEFDLPEDFDGYFDHLYGLGSHIARLRMAIEVGQMSQYSNRYHVALIGAPGCGKSDMCETLAGMLGEEVVMKFDATATTAAGAIKQLDEADPMPRILVVEEIEKVSPEALSFLLALMDMRGEIRKTTAKKSIVKDTKILVIATVNNHELFDKMLAGALSSRFANKLWFHRPDEATLTRILRREVVKLDGDEEWIAPAIAYAKEKEITDPRMVTALCLCGRDGWLDGSFAKMLSDTDKPEEYNQ